MLAAGRGHETAGKKDPMLKECMRGVAPESCCWL